MEAALKFTSAIGVAFLFEPKCLPDFLEASQFASSNPLFHPVDKIDAVSLYGLAILTILGRTYDNGALRGFS